MPAKLSHCQFRLLINDSLYWRSIVFDFSAVRREQELLRGPDGGQVQFSGDPRHPRPARRQADHQVRAETLISATAGKKKSSKCGSFSHFSLKSNRIFDRVSLKNGLL